jgi:hypothetical protein
MQFTKRLREPIKRGEITTSIRIWKRPKMPSTPLKVVVGAV